jgi:hypothetical protein
MVDECTIGIALVLDNGVSEGLASIHRDLSTLNGVVDNSAIRLSQLTRVAADLRYWPSAAFSDANQPPRAEFSEDGKPKPPAEISSWDHPAQRGWNPPSLDKPTKLYIDMLSTRDSRSTENLSSYGSSHNLTKSSSDESFLNSGSDPPSNRSHEAGEVIYRAAVNPSSYVTRDPLGTPPAILDDRLRGGFSVLPTMATPGDPILIDAETPQPPSGTSSTPAFLPEGRPQRFGSSLWPESTQAASSSNSTAPDRDLTVETHRSDTEVTSPSEAVSQTESQSLRLQGDILIDGSKLGRWVTDRLVKAAGMPRAAATGFDSRMTPTWPGAPISA